MSKRKGRLSGPERAFDGMASTHAKDSGYPWKRSGSGIGGTGTSWSLTTNDASPAPEFETLCSVALDAKTGKVLLATYKLLPELTDLYTCAVPCVASITSYESAGSAMAAAEIAYERGLDTARP